MSAHEHVAFWSVNPAHRRYGLADPTQNPLIRMGWKIHRNRVNAWLRDHSAGFCATQNTALFQAGIQ